MTAAKPAGGVPAMWLAIALALLLVPARASAQWVKVDFQDPPPFTMKWSGGSQPLYVMTNAGPCGPNVPWNFSHVPAARGNGGYADRGYVRWTWCSDEKSRVRISPSGWTGAGRLFKPESGWPADAFYARVRIFVEQPIKVAGGGDPFRQFKFFIWHRSVFDGDQRVIGFLENGSNCGKSDGSHICFTLQRNINHRAETATVPLAVGAWSHLQFAWRHGPEGTSFLKVWLNNNNPAKPTAQDLTLDATPLNPKRSSEWFRDDAGYDQPFQLGNMANTGTKLKDDFVLRLMDFELDGRFDPAWHPEKPRGTK
jgi:hypothetical protein